MLDVVQLFRAKVVDVAPDAITIEVTGNSDKLADFLRVIEPFGIRELVQSGMVALGRGSRSITERSSAPGRRPGRRPPSCADARAPAGPARHPCRSQSEFLVPANPTPEGAPSG